MKDTVTISIEDFENLNKEIEDLKLLNKLTSDKLSILDHNSAFLYKETIKGILKHFNKVCETPYIDGNYCITMKRKINKIKLVKIDESSDNNYVSIFTITDKDE